jgi:hypothetical protein
MINAPLCLKQPGTAILQLDLARSLREVHPMNRRANQSIPNRRNPDPVDLVRQAAVSASAALFASGGGA